jgi:hypothetical protein
MNNLKKSLWIVFLILPYLLNAQSSSIKKMEVITTDNSWNYFDNNLVSWQPAILASGAPVYGGRKIRDNSDPSLAHYYNLSKTICLNEIPDSVYVIMSSDDRATFLVNLSPLGIDDVSANPCFNWNALQTSINPSVFHLGMNDIEIDVENICSSNTWAVCRIELYKFGEPNPNYSMFCSPCTVHVDFEADTTQNPVVFTSTSTYSNTGVPNYLWNFGDGTISTGTGDAVISHTYAVPGKYNVCLNVILWDTIENKMVCCDMLCKDIYVNVDTTQRCVARLSVINQINGNTVTITDNSVINTTITTSVWQFDDEDDLLSGLSVTHTFDQPGRHIIVHYIGVTSPWGPCCGIILDTIDIVGDSLPTQALKTKTPNKVGFGNFNPKIQNTFKLFPNPASSKINLLYTYSGNEIYGVLNLNRMDGQLAFAEQFSLTQTAPLEFDISDVSNGMYFYTIVSKQGVVLSSGKLTIMHND